MVNIEWSAHSLLTRHWVTWIVFDNKCLISRRWWETYVSNLWVLWENPANTQQDSLKIRACMSSEHINLQIHHKQGWVCSSLVVFSVGVSKTMYELSLIKLYSTLIGQRFCSWLLHFPDEDLSKQPICTKYHSHRRPLIDSLSYIGFSTQLSGKTDFLSFL